MTESVKTKEIVCFWKLFEVEFEFSKFSSIRSNALYLGVSKRTKWLAALSTARFA